MRVAGRLRAHEYAAGMPPEQFVSHLTAAILAVGSALADPTQLPRLAAIVAGE